LHAHAQSYSERNMNAPAVNLLVRQPALLWRRVRGLFAGTGFLLVMDLAINVMWLLDNVRGEIPEFGLSGAWRRQAPETLFNLYNSAPMLPFVALIVNLAPATGWRRAAHYIGAYVLIMCWDMFADLHGGFLNGTTLAALAGELEASLTAVLLLWAFAYYRAASQASDTLARAQIDIASRDAELKQARLQLLRAQIEPHFLFNTLATIHTLARTERSAAIQLIDNFMQYLAAALPKLRHEETALADEMQLIDAYLGIYQLRMGRRLSYEIALPPELAALRISTMILLTLVENALKHGINPAIEGGFIRVSAAQESSLLVLRVADSGRGMQSQHGQGSGLANARLRLMMRYGDEASLSLAPAEPRGVIATVRIPMSMAA
jgi:sensor histidine kinase YesM